MHWPFSRPLDIEKTGDHKPVSNIYAFLWRMTGRHQIYVGLIALAVAAVSVAPVDLQRRLINEGVEDRNLDVLLWLGGIYLGFILLRRTLKFWLGLYQGWLAESTILYCRDHLARISLDRLGRSLKRSDTEDEDADLDDEMASGGESVSVIRSEIDQVGQFVGIGISEPVQAIAKLVFAIGYMLFVEPLVALIALAFFVPQFVLLPFLQKVLNRLIRKRTDLLRALSDAIVSMDPNRDQPSDTFSQRLDDIFGNRMKSVLFKFLIKTIINVLNALAPLSVLVFGGYMYIQGDTSLGVIVAFASGFERMADPTRTLVSYYRVASLKNEQHDKIAEWMHPAGSNGK